MSTTSSICQRYIPWRAWYFTVFSLLSLSGFYCLMHSCGKLDTSCISCMHLWMLIVSFWLWLCHSPILLSSCQCPKSFRMLDYLFTYPAYYCNWVSDDWQGLDVVSGAPVLPSEGVWLQLTILHFHLSSVSFSLCDTQIVRAVHHLFTTT